MTVGRHGQCPGHGQRKVGRKLERGDSALAVSGDSGHANPALTIGRQAQRASEGDRIVGVAARPANDMRRAAEAIAERARDFYRQARRTLPGPDRRSMVAAELMGSVYWRLLEKLQATGFNVFGSEPTSLSKLQKAALILRTWFRINAGAVAPNYGTP